MYPISGVFCRRAPVSCRCNLSWLNDAGWLKPAISAFRPANCLAYFRVAHRSILLKQVKQRAQRLPALARKLDVAIADQAGVVAGDGQQVGVMLQIGEFKARHAALFGPQHLARATQFQVLLRDDKAIVGRAQCLQPRLRRCAKRQVIQQHAG